MLVVPVYVSVYQLSMDGHVDIQRSRLLRFINLFTYFTYLLTLVLTSSEHVFMHFNYSYKLLTFSSLPFPFPSLTLSSHPFPSLPHLFFPPLINILPFTFLPSPFPFYPLRSLPPPLPPILISLLENLEKVIPQPWTTGTSVKITGTNPKTTLF